MGDKTGIGWTDATWNPTSGCDRVSPGCDHCYALTMAGRLRKMGAPNYQHDGDPATSGPGFGLTMHDGMLDKPLRWTRPRMVFVNSMSDLFHAEVTDEFIAQVFAVMAMSPWHTFQVLTKRHGRMRSLVSSDAFHGAVINAMFPILDSHPQRRRLSGENCATWPLPNVWLGVSAEDQHWADIRIPALLATPAAVRFVSAEPLLGPLNVARWVPNGFFDGARWNPRPSFISNPGATLDWVIVGGESGPGHRPMDLAWARSIRDQCATAGVAFFMKQTGESVARDLGLSSRHGADPAEWPEPFVQEFPA